MEKKSPPFGSPKEGRSFPYYIVSNTYSSSKEALASPMKLSSLYSFPAFEEKKHNVYSKLLRLAGSGIFFNQKHRVF